MARTKSELLQERKERTKSEWYEGHKQYLKSTNSFRKYGGVPDSTGKVYDLDSRGKALARKINSPKAQLKRSLRHDEHEGHQNKFGSYTLARLNKK